MVWSRQDEPAAMTSRKACGGSGGSRGAACAPSTYSRTIAACSRRRSHALLPETASSRAASAE